MDTSPIKKTQVGDCNMLQHPHRRYNPLKDEWVLISPHRTKCPWNGTKEKRGDDELFQHMPVSGTCKVVRFSAQHDVTLAQMDVKDIARTFSTIQKEVVELEKTYAWVQVMGCSNPHPHCQIWASDAIPNVVARENATQKKYADEQYSIMLADYRGDELMKKERVITENEDWVVVIPYWAVWQYETMVLPKKDMHRFNEVKQDNIESFAHIVQKLLKGYDRLFQTSFSYSMGLHGAPVGEKADRWLFHAHYYPTTKKHLVGYEMLAEAQCDITAEQAAKTLRESVG